MDFGKYANYMAMGYAALGIILFVMIAWIAWRYRVLLREQDLVEQMAEEEQLERASAVAARARNTLDSDATPIMRDMTAPTLTEET
jgi:hypothetical protein